LNSRADLVHEIGLLKRKGGMATYAPEREEKLLRLWQTEFRWTTLPNNRPRDLSTKIMSARSRSKKSDHCLSRPAATWTHQAAR